MFGPSVLLCASLISFPCGGPGPGCEVVVRVKGVSLTIIVDTGADIVALTASGAKKAGLRITRSSPKIPVQGVNASSTMVLARVPVSVGGFAEDDVLVAVAESDFGRGDGLLGMTYLERFRYQMGRGQIVLTPIDQNEQPKKGKRGRSWWSLRFHQNQKRLSFYESLLSGAKKVDEQIHGAIGRDSTGESATRTMTRLRDFMADEKRQLMTQAGRFGVPHAWRR